MKLTAAHEPAGDVGRLQLGTFRRRMSTEIAGDGDEDMPALVGIAPLAELPHAGVQTKTPKKARGDSRQEWRLHCQISHTETSSYLRPRGTAPSASQRTASHVGFFMPVRRSGCARFALPARLGNPVASWMRGQHPANCRKLRLRDRRAFR